METQDYLQRLRQGTRIHDPNGKPVGYIRDVSRGSILISELFGKRVYWLEASLVHTVDGEIRLRTTSRVSVPDANDRLLAEADADA